MRGAPILAATFLCLAPSAWGQGQEVQAADRFTNGFLMDQSERDRRIFIGALIVGTSTTASFHDVETGRCIARWYFENEQAVYANIVRSMELYPDRKPVEVVYALAERECPGLVPQD